jgi:hypothetical protein
MIKIKRIPWNKGIPHTAESNEKNRQSHLGKPSWSKGLLLKRFCPKGHDKLITGIYKKDGVSGYSSCKICQTENRTQSKHVRVDFINGLKMSNPCMDCKQFYNFWQMDFDHSPKFKKVGNVAEMLHRGMAFDSIIREIRKCELVCKNCHATRTQIRLGNLIDL